jgi:hypothetical protein
MTNETALLELPKSALAEHAGSGTSEKYLFIPTTQVVSALNDLGWSPVWGKEVKTRAPQRVGFQKHIIRFRKTDPANEIRIGDSLAELVMVNSHDRTSAYQFRAGIYRLVCENGLIVSTAEFGAIKARHAGSLESILDASMQITNKMPEVAEMVAEMGKKELDAKVQLQMAARAGEIRWGQDQKIVAPEMLLETRRDEDKPNDLWTVFNRIQENVLRGGMEGRGRRVTAIRGMQRNLGINERLWEMAREVATAA